jgi:hypothetical protein
MILDCSQRWKGCSAACTGKHQGAAGTAALQSEIASPEEFVKK